MSLLDKYNALAVADHMVLQALSTLYEPAAATVVSSCLAGAGCRESPLRAFTPQIVATRLARLSKAGFASDQTVENRGQKIRLWRPKPEAAEIALRHAVRDGRFLPMAKAALTETRGRDWRGEGAEDSPARRFRLAFHAGDWRLAGREFAVIAAAEPGAGGGLLASLVKLQPDDSWKRTAKPAFFAPVLAMAYRDLAAGLGDPSPLDDIAQETADKCEPGRDREDLVLALVESLTLRGKLKDADKMARTADADAQPALSVMPALAEGRADATDLAESAFARRRPRPGARDALPPDGSAVWQTLAILSGDNPDAIETMLRRLSSPGAQANPLAGALSSLRHALLFMAGQASAARALADRPPDRHPLTLLAHGLAMLRIDPSRMSGLLPALEQAAGDAQSGGYRWLAGQFESLASAARGGTSSLSDPAKPDRRPSLARFFTTDDAWRRALRALDDLALDGGEENPEQKKRLAWLVAFPARPENPYVPFELQPVEQTMGKDGVWSKGRNIALKRIFQRAGDLNYVTDQDRMVFSTLRYDYDGLNQGFHFDGTAAFPHLAGHPLVYRGDAGGAKLEIVSGQFELSVAADGDGGCEISMEPDIAEFVGADAAAEIAGDELPDTAARLETPTRLRVYSLGGRERRLARVVGDGLAVPARGRDEALSTLGRLSGKIRIHSDIPELAGEGEAVPADARPRFHIMPQNPGIKVEVWSHPLGDGGPAYRPGKGGRVLTADLEGRTVRTTRDAAREKALAAEVIAACPALAGKEDGDMSWLLDHPEDALTFLSETEDLGGGAVLAWPKGGRFRVRRLKGPGGLSLRVNSSSEWFDVDGSLTVDEGLVVDMAKLLAALRDSKSRFVEIGEGEYLALTNELRRQLGDLEAMGEFQNGRFRLSSLAGSMLEELEDAGADLQADAAWRAELRRRRDLADFTPELPADFHAELRTYQEEGFRWMARLAEWGAGACLADDMGLGKTVQALAILARRGGMGPALVIAPTSVCHNWIAETARFAPRLRIAPLGEGGDRAAQVAALGAGDILIASYSLLRREDALLTGVKWATVVLDEAQAIKNVAAKRSKAAMALNAGFRLITTGTPIENHLGELWNLFHFINPRLLGSWRRFQDRFAAPIERFHDKDAADRLRRIIRPFILRRTKSQVLDSLPPKTEITLAVELGDRERAFYESLRRSALERLEEGTESAEKKRFQILAEIMRLRRACCSPELVPGGAGILSAKQEQFRTTLGELVENGHKALVFSQFVDHLSIIRRHLEKSGYAYQYLDGSTPAKARKKAVEDFQSGRGDVFLISLKAGGLGLNLTAADYVIHMDPWWNPAVEDQASDRAHRIGQDKPVTVYRLVAADTIEEKIVRLHRDKRDLADNLLAGSDQAGSLDMDEIMRLLRDD